MNLSEDEQLDWFERYTLGELNQTQVDELESYLRDHPEARKRFRQYLRLDAYLQIQSQSRQELENENLHQPVNHDRSNIIRFTPVFLSVAALLFVALVAKLLINAAQLRDNNLNSVVTEQESQLKGYAVVRRLLNNEWHGQKNLTIGDLISDETIEVKKGLVQIDFFCGASVVLQGPAKLEVTSAWSATCHEGELRAVVPPAARGFKIDTAQGQIEDLGTEFSVSVKNNQAQVHVLDGKVLVHNENKQTHEMNSGDRVNFTSSGHSEALGNHLAIAGLDEIKSGSAGLFKASFNRWSAHRDQLISDKRLLAYYPMDKGHWLDNTIVDASHYKSETPNDAIMLGFAKKDDGRFQTDKYALDVRRPDARARVFIEGTFKAFTFFTWARIDSLAHQYNALFMGDSYNNGEPHWQIREDGTLMLSVMVREQDRDKPKSRYHLVYFSPEFWNDSLSGKWIQIASTYDPINREVVHYFNGEVLSRQSIKDEFYIKDLKIGGAEIGSWGLPFRANDTHFALRNLNGLIDELMIFDGALSAEEIKDLYQKSRP